MPHFITIYQYQQTIHQSIHICINIAHTFIHTSIISISCEIENKKEKPISLNN